MKPSGESDQGSAPQDPSRPYPLRPKHSQPAFSRPKAPGRGGVTGGRQAYTTRVSRRDRHHHRPGK